MAIGILLIILLLVLLATTIAVVADRRRRPVDGSRAAQFLRAHGARDTADAVAFAAGYLDRRSSLRWACALVALLGVNAVGLLVSDDPSLRIDLFPIMGAYAVGTLLAELRLARSRGTVARASLTARTVDQYLGSTWLKVQRVTTVLAAVLMGTTTLVATELEASRSVAGPGLYGLAALVVGLGGEWAQRRIVGQAQPSTAPDLLAADDAVRTSSVHAIAGVAIAFLVMTAAAATSMLTGFVLPAVLGVLLGLFLWYPCAQPAGTSRRVVLAAVALVAAVVVAGTGAVLLLRGGSVSEMQPAVPEPVVTETTVAVP